MKDTLINKLQHIQHRFEEIAALLSSPEIIGDQNQFRQLSKEYASLEPTVNAFKNYQANVDAITDTQGMIKEGDAEMRQLAEAELTELKGAHQNLEQQLQALLLPTDPNDDCNIFLEIRAGTGGDEAAIFVGDLFRMYSRYAESQKWHIEILSANNSDRGGYKEVICRITGNAVYSKLKFESGAHRVQRVPTTETQGRVHTSACTVAIIAEQEQIEEIELNPADLRIDTYRSSGAGGQHVNTTDSAVRITHIPTGVVAECQDERSQHKNKARAMSLLQAKILDTEQQKQQQEQAETRRNLVGSGDRSERIRTYNFPQGRLTDHRINLTLYKLEEIIQGDLEPVVSALAKEYQADLLAQSSHE